MFATIMSTDKLRRQPLPLNLQIYQKKQQTNLSPKFEEQIYRNITLVTGDYLLNVWHNTSQVHTFKKVYNTQGLVMEKHVRGKL